MFRFDLALMTHSHRHHLLGIHDSGCFLCRLFAQGAEDCLDIIRSTYLGAVYITITKKLGNLTRTLPFQTRHRLDSFAFSFLLRLMLLFVSVPSGDQHEAWWEVEGKKTGLLLLNNAVHISSVEHGLLDDLVCRDVDLFVLIRMEVCFLLHWVDLPVSLLRPPKIEDV